ncbi:MAG: PFL family protein [Planctomycetota bacterium]|nr:MAG: PFL family protein [Planctomycetota bacterium]
MPLDHDEILRTLRMVQVETLDVRTTTLGVNLLDLAGGSVQQVGERIYERLVRRAGNLVEVANSVGDEFGVPIVNKRIAVTPISLVAAACPDEDYTPIAQAMDRAADEVGVDFIGGFSALVHKGATRSDERLMNSIPNALAVTDHVCASVNLGTTKAGINMDATLKMARVIKATAERTADNGAMGCAKLVVFCNMVEDNPFVAGANLGIGERDVVLHCGVSGPGVVRHAVAQLSNTADLGEVADVIKRVAFQITRMGELVGRTVAERMGVPFGVIDLSLAPTPALGDSIADILELMGLERTGAHGTTLALALLTDAVKKGGAMAATNVGGMSGAFIPVSEDAGMIAAVREGVLTLDKLEAMTAVCSVGLDMVGVPGDTSAETLCALIGDELAIGMVNHKTTAVRIMPVPGAVAGDLIELGGLLGSVPIQPVNKPSASIFARRGGQVPAPIQSLRN